MYKKNIQNKIHIQKQSILLICNGNLRYQTADEEILEQVERNSGIDKLKRQSKGGGWVLFNF